MVFEYLANIVKFVYNNERGVKMKYKQYDFESYRVLTIQSEQFKNVHMEINFIDDVANLFMPLRSFLINLMGYTSKIYPTKRDMLIALENLYNSAYYFRFCKSKIYK